MSTQWSIIANRKDQTNQPVWTEYRLGAVAVGGTPAQAGDAVLLNSNGQIDSSLLPPISSITVEVGGVPVSDQNILNFIAGTNISITPDSSGGITISASGTIATSFDNISSGSNTTANMVVGSGATLTYSGSGIVDANEIGGIGIDGNTPAHAGQLLISQPGNSTAVWADPMVQGLFPPSTNVNTGNSGGAINPVLVGGQNPSNLLSNLRVDSSGNLLISGSVSASQSGTWDIGSLTSITDTVTIAGTVTADQGGAPWSVTQSGTWNIGSLTSITDTVTIAGTVTADQGTNPWATEDAADGTVGNSVGTNVIGIGFKDSNGKYAFANLDSSGNLRVTSTGGGGGGGGTQYNDDTAITPPVGTVAMGFDGTDVWALRLDGSHNLNVNVQTGSVVVRGQDAPGAAPTVNPIEIAGVDSNGNVQRVLTTTSGAVVTVSEDEAIAAAHYSINSGSALTSISSLSVPLISLKAQTSASSITFVFSGLDIFTAPTVGLWQLVKNGSLTSSSFANVSGTNAQRDTSATAISGGTVVDSGYSSIGTRERTYALPFVAGDVFTLVVNTDVNGSSSNTSGALRWTEQTISL